MHVKWSRHLDGLPKVRDKFKSTSLKLCDKTDYESAQRTKVRVEEWSWKKDSGKNFLNFFKGQCLRKQDWPSKSLQTKQQPTCSFSTRKEWCRTFKSKQYIGHKLEYHTCLLSDSQYVSPSSEFELTATSFDLLKLEEECRVRCKKEYGSANLSAPRENNFIDNNFTRPCKRSVDWSEVVFHSPEKCSSTFCDGLSQIDMELSAISDCNLSDSLEPNGDENPSLDVWWKFGSNRDQQEYFSLEKQFTLPEEFVYPTNQEETEEFPLTHSRSGNSPKWSVSPMLKTSIQRTEPKKFVSKTELVKEIQQLGALCESRTKELTLLKIQLRQATLGFEALAIINKHMVEELDPFSQPRLTREYKRALEELENAGTQLQLYQIQLEELKKIHGDELIELAEKLGIVHTDEINELKLKHNAELAEVDSHHRQQIKNLKEIFQKESEDNDEQNSKLFKELQEDCQKQKEDLEDTHAKKLFEINRQHEEIQAELYNQLRELRLQYEMLQRQVKEAEEAFLKDKNSKIQYISSKKVELEKEVDSLKAVLEMKSSQIHDLNKQKFQMLKELEELPIAKEKIKKLETKTEDLRAMMQAKVQKQRELSSENQQLLMSFEKETRDNTRLSMANEELEWRLRYSKEASLRSTSLSGSPELYDSLYNPLENDRSSSRMSLPTLQSEKQRSSPADVLNNPLMTSSMPLPQSDDRPIGRCHSMSVSWHPVLPTHNETSSPNGPTPHRQRSRSTKVFRASFQSPSKISSYKLKKDIEAEFLRRNSLGPKSQFLSSKLSRPQLCKDVNQPMSMSWGGESIADYYEDLDDNYVQIFTPRHQNTGREKHRVTLKPGSTADKNNKGDVSVNNSSHKCSGNLNDDLCNYTYKGVAQKTIDLAENSIQNGLEADMMEVDRSLAGVNSLQSSFTSSTDSSGSFLPTQTGSEDSSCSTKSHEADSNNQSDRNGNNPIYDLGSYVKSPRNLAGEAMVQDVDSLTHIPSQVFSGETSVEQNGQTKLVNCFFDCDLSSSPEEGKEKATNVVSVGTPSMETSSQGMADSTNIDISWGDDEMPSEYDS